MSDEETTHSVQTEETNLCMVTEASLGHRTPPSTGWENIDPNSYGEFAGQYKKLPRDPITKKMQQQKAMLVDEDSGIAFEVDVTLDNVDRFGKYIYRAVTRHCGNTGQSLWRPTAVVAGGSGGFTVSALGALSARYLVVARGSDKDANNGLFMVQSGSTNTLLRVNSLVAEPSPPSNMRVDLAGYRGAVSDLFLDTDGNLNSNGAINFTTWNVNEFQWLYIGGEDAANQFATTAYFGAARIAADGIAATKITFDMWDWDVEAHASLDITDVATNFDTVVEAIASGVAGNSITVASVADGAVAAKAEIDMDAAGNTAHVNNILRAKVGGVAGNLITVEVTSGAPTAAGVLTEIGTHVKIQIKITATATTVADLEALITGSSTLLEVKTPGTGGTSLDATDVMDSAVLTGGTAAAAANVTEVGSAVTLHYTPSTTTVAQMEAAITALSTKIRIKRAGTPGHVLLVTADDFSATNLAGGSDGDDDGNGKQIDVYFTRWWRNVSRDDDDFIKPSACFEETWPELADDGSDMYEYMLGNMLDTCVVNLPVTSKATMQLGWKGTRTMQLTSTRKAGPASAIDPVTKLGVSTATDLQRLRIDDVDGNGVTSDFTMVKLSVNNNVSPEKQLGTLGAKIVNNGDHIETFEGDVIFTSPTVVNAVRTNVTCTFQALARNTDFGCMWDLQAMTLDKSPRKMERNKSVKVGSTGSGHEHDKSGATGSLSMFAFCPAKPDLDLVA